jgi:hypothetical protein
MPIIKSDATAVPYSCTIVFVMQYRQPKMLNSQGQGVLVLTQDGIFSTGIDSASLCSLSYGPIPASTASYARDVMYRVGYAPA